MFLFIVLAIIQTTLAIPVVLVISFYWDVEAEKGSVRDKLFNFMTGMCSIEALAWVGSEIALTSANGGLALGIEVVTSTLSVNVIFILSILLAVLSEMRIREAEHRKDRE